MGCNIQVLLFREWGCKLGTLRHVFVQAATWTGFAPEFHYVCMSQSGQQMQAEAVVLLLSSRSIRVLRECISDMASWLMVV